GVDGALGAFGYLADFGDLAIDDRDVGLVAGCTGPVDDRATLDQQIVAHSCLPRISEATRSPRPERAEVGLVRQGMVAAGADLERASAWLSSRGRSPRDLSCGLQGPSLRSG